MGGLTGGIDRHAESKGEPVVSGAGLTHTDELSRKACLLWVRPSQNGRGKFVGRSCSALSGLGS